MEEILRAIAQKYDLLPSELTGALSIASNEQSKLDKAQARIVELEAMMDRQFQDIIALQDQNETAYARITELEAALRPFAVWSAEYLEMWAVRNTGEREFEKLADRIVCTINDKSIVLGDMRRANAALAGDEPATRGERDGIFIKRN